MRCVRGACVRCVRVACVCVCCVRGGVNMCCRSVCVLHVYISTVRAWYAAITFR